jgi:hypothetical protein
MSFACAEAEEGVVQTFSALAGLLASIASDARANANRTAVASGAFISSSYVVSSVRYPSARL